MVQIIDRQPSRLESILQSLSQGVQGLAPGAEALGGALKDRQTRGALAERFGEEFRNIRDPEIRQQMLRGSLEKENLQDRFKADEMSLPDYQTVENRFGKEFADLYKAAPVGGKTELLKAGLDAMLRGQNVQEMFSGISSPKQNKINSTSKTSTFPEYSLPTEGMTPKEKIVYKHELRKFNDPIFRETVKSIDTNDKTLRSVSELEKLSPKIPEGLARFFYNKEGGIRPLAQVLKLVPPEAELYVKIVNDFTTQAKESYGARVSNFELDRFMQRLPTLINSREGRELILKRMKNVAELDKMHQQALRDVYRHYKLDNITPEDAESFAEDLIKQRADELIKNSEQLDQQMESMSSDKALGNFDEASTQSRPSLEEIFG